MRFWLVIFFSGLYAGPASKGAATEARFILENKLGDLSEYIQDLKKRITECSVKKPEQQDSYEYYYCQLGRQIFSSSMKEFEEYSKLLADYKERFSQDELPEDALVKKAVDIAFLLKEKIGLEKELLKLIFAIDRDEHTLLQREKEMRSRHRGTQRVTLSRMIKQLRMNISSFRKKLPQVRRQLRQVNNKLSRLHTIKERLYLEQLRCYGNHIL